MEEEKENREGWRRLRNKEWEKQAYQEVGNNQKNRKKKIYEREKRRL